MDLKVHPYITLWPDWLWQGWGEGVGARSPKASTGDFTERPWRPTRCGECIVPYQKAWGVLLYPLN